MKKEIKISHKNEIKRFEIPKTFSELKEIIQKCFKQMNNTEFQITYLDDEQDNVVISNEFDLEQVLLFMEKQKVGLLRAFLEISNEEFYASVDEVDKKSISNSILIDTNLIIIEDKLVEIKHEEKFEKKEEELKNDEQLIQNIENPKSIIEIKEESFLEEKKLVLGEMNEEKESIIGVIDINDNLFIFEENKGEFQIEEKKEKDGKVEIIEEKKELIKKEKNEVKKNNKNEIKEESTLNKKQIGNDKDYDNDLKKLIKSQNKELKKYLSKIIKKKFEKLKQNLVPKKIKKNSSEKKIEFQQLLTKSQKINSDLILHDIQCKGCEASQIIGIRYKCSICHNFDYCENCEEQLALLHNHPFLKIRIPLPNKEIFQKKELMKENERLLSKVDKKNLDCKCIGENYFEFEQGKSQITFTVKFENTGNLSFPNQYFLKNIHGIFGDKVNVNEVIMPGERVLIKINFITKNLKVGEYQSRWQLFDEKDCCFGCFADISFKVIPKKEILIDFPFNQDEIKNKEEKVVYRFYGKLSEMKNLYYLTDVPNEKILDALEKANGNMDEAIIHLL